MKFSIGDRAWYHGKFEVELYGMEVLDGKIIWRCRAIGGVSARHAAQDDLSERALTVAERQAAGY